MSTITRWTMLRMTAIIGLLVMGLVGSVQPAQAAYGYMSYVRFDWYRQANGTFNIVMVYCVNADNNAVIWGERSPSQWQATRSYGRQNGCASRPLFEQVNVNDDMYTTVLTNPVVGDSDEEAHFRLRRTSTGYSCELQSTYRNGLKRVSTSVYPCAWTK